MTARPQTSLALGAPWPGKTAPARRYGPRVDLSALTITDDAPPVARCRSGNKYDDFFETLRADKRVKCPPEMVNPVANALRSWLKRRQIGGRVVSQRVCEDGAGGVWWRNEKPGSRKASKP